LWGTGEKQRIGPRVRIQEVKKVRFICGLRGRGVGSQGEKGKSEMKAVLESGVYLREKGEELGFSPSE